MAETLAEYQRVEIYLGPCWRCEMDIQEATETIRLHLKQQGIRAALVVGNSANSFDYSVDKIEKEAAVRITGAINRLEGFAAKAVDLKP